MAGRRDTEIINKLLNEVIAERSDASSSPKVPKKRKTTKSRSRSPKRRSSSSSPKVPKKRSSSSGLKRENVFLYKSDPSKRGMQVQIIRMETDGDGVIVETLGERKRKIKTKTSKLHPLPSGKKVGTRVRAPKSKSKIATRRSSSSSPVVPKKKTVKKKSKIRSKSKSRSPSPRRSRSSSSIKIPKKRTLSPRKKGQMIVDVCFDEDGRLKCGPGKYCGINKKGGKVCATKETLQGKFGATSGNLNEEFRLVGKPDAVKEAVRLLKEIERISDFSLSPSPRASSMPRRKSSSLPIPVPIRRRPPPSPKMVSLDISDKKFKCGDEYCGWDEYCDLHTGTCSSEPQMRPGYKKDEKYFLTGTENALRKARSQISKLNEKICRGCDDEGKSCVIDNQRAWCEDPKSNFVQSQTHQLSFSDGRKPILGSEEALEELSKFVGGNLERANTRVSSLKRLSSSSPVGGSLRLSSSPKRSSPRRSPSPQRMAPFHPEEEEESFSRDVSDPSQFTDEDGNVFSAELPDDDFEITERFARRRGRREKSPKRSSARSPSPYTRMSRVHSPSVEGENIFLTPEGNLPSPRKSSSKRKSPSPSKKRPSSSGRKVGKPGDKTRGRGAKEESLNLEVDFAKCLRHLREGKKK